VEDWKWSISFVRFHKRNLRHLARFGWASMFIGPEPVLNIRLVALFLTTTLRGISLQAQAS